MNIAILGGTGYLGRKLMGRLSEKGHHIVCITRKRNIDSSEINVKYICIDDLFNLKLSKIDILILASGQYEKESVSYSCITEANAIAPIQVLEYFLGLGMGNIIYVGSALPPQLNTYAYTKRMVSDFGRFCVEKRKMDITFCNVLLENFYGEDEPENRFISRNFKLLEQNIPLRLTEGIQKRDFIYIDDVIQAFLILIQDWKKWGGYFDLPIGTGEKPSVRDVVIYQKEIMRSKSELLFGVLPNRENEPQDAADVKIMQKYGVIPGRNWRDGIKICMQKRQLLKNNIIKGYDDGARAHKGNEVI